MSNNRAKKRRGGDESDNYYIYFAQANLWKSSNASHELGLYLNKVMKSYRYFSEEKAGIMIDGRPEMDDNYRNRLRDVGIIVNDEDEIISRPSRDEMGGLKANGENRRNSKRRKASQSFITAMAQNERDEPSPVWRNISIDQLTQISEPPPTPAAGALPAAFVCGVQEPFLGRLDAS